MITILRHFVFGSSSIELFESFRNRIAGWGSVADCSIRTKKMELGYLIVDEFHKLETEIYRRPRFEGIAKVNLDAFKKDLFLSGTALAPLADGSLRRIAFASLQRDQEL